MAPLARAAVERFRDAVRGHFPDRLQEFVLFGSQARGDVHEDSDVDILVVIDALTEDERRLLFDLAYDAGATDDELILLSPLPYSTEQAADLRSREKRLMLEIARDGVAL